MMNTGIIDDHNDLLVGIALHHFLQEFQKRSGITGICRCTEYVAGLRIYGSE
ncbi:hypothetical protein SAMN04489735_104333 [Aneurinibacillus thermoaerophilus]|uniref:Uncharacterized protein n=1 Tax=Aneurinibacillus thermoaerophilus TaxID=143495 RepID=A0A1G8EG08_ANETH|nr:hypothetical protein SAMN04489735_104333 [Aneurinibacillus thermoaerophilus]